MDVEFPSGDDRIRGYLALPKGPGPHRAILVVQEIWGLTPHIKDLADRFAKDHGGGVSWPYEPWDDGNTVTAPVGSYRANSFGLYNVHGNLWEWCREWYASYRRPVAPGDGERQVPSAYDGARVCRGGTFNNSAARARSTSRSRRAPKYSAINLGLRPARATTAR